MNNNPQETVRTFITIELTDEARKELACLQLKIRQNCNPDTAKWVAPANIHLTLQFLGETPIINLDVIKNVVNRVGASHNAFAFRLSGLGAFPGIDRPRVIWVGIEGDIGSLSDMQKHLQQRLLSETGIGNNSLPFSPHLTLARVRDDASVSEKQKLGQAVSSISFASKNSIKVNRISLIKSQLTPRGPLYTVLFSAELGPKK